MSKMTLTASVNYSEELTLILSKDKTKYHLIKDYEGHVSEDDKDNRHIYYFYDLKFKKNGENHMYEEIVEELEQINDFLKKGEKLAKKFNVNFARTKELNAYSAKLSKWIKDHDKYAD